MKTKLPLKKQYINKKIITELCIELDRLVTEDNILASSEDYL